ncbi:VanZ family protein [Bacillus sp. 1P06AnD]|uniref:VanZ family protein n=1 Tax=Bacillus sp. 1P06AnD TaxID=3132208 RepID=UPI0039A29556
MGKKRWIQISACILLGGYLLLIGKDFLFKYYSIAEAFTKIQSASGSHMLKGWEEANFRPFTTLMNDFYLSEIPLLFKLKSITEFIVLFSPLGILLPLIDRRFGQFQYILPALIFFGVLVEASQWIFQVGVFDVDHILLYTLGGLLGYYPLKSFYYMKREFLVTVEVPVAVYQEEEHSAVCRQDEKSL